ncbi:hypothetical protein L596_014955 [Steinernema carpocapsae]|uniref:DUF19 domain-containing protein n=1 Tax=Steinernema carpocapsae TaxID=34508 RepID=A0A4V6A2X6_STECR|nr:hypothetical protein L596_014955 [Steinernema carpocapsae]
MESSVFAVFIIVQLLLPSTSSQSACSDQLQRCGVIVEDFERQIQDLKNGAFKNCFTKPECLKEKMVFDDCYAKSVRAVRAPFNDDYSSLANDGFFDSAERYRNHLEQCFAGLGSRAPLEFSSSLAVDEDAIYARAVFGTKFADRLWGLPELGFGKASLDSEGSCLIKAFSSRVWGSGIGRMVDSVVSDARNESCRMTAEETSCYRRFLDHDHTFQALLQSRDRALRNCVQSVRLQSQCRGGDSPYFRSCICNAREELENRLQASLLECTRKSDVGQVYSVLIDGKTSANKGLGSLKKLPAPQEALRISTRPTYAQPQQSPPLTTSGFSQGFVLNGQCLCSCPQQPQPQRAVLPQQPMYAVGRPYMEEVVPVEPAWNPYWTQTSRRQVDGMRLSKPARSGRERQCRSVMRRSRNLKRSPNP